LSGGQQQRVALARALVMNPEVLLLDEPLSNLDAKLRVTIRTELISIQRQLGLTTVYVTHDQDEALAMSDWVAVMNQGRVVQWGTPWEVYYKPRTPFMAEFVGSVNLIWTPIVQADERTVEVKLGDTSLQLAVDELPRGDKALLSIRPETLALLPQAPVSLRRDGNVSLAGRIVHKEFLGHLMRYTVRVAQQDWLVDQPDPGHGTPLEGEVLVEVNPRRVHVIPEPEA
jgi:ABC-type Fe3+/spermidine/putrescine transport system ATPase subunit